MSEQEFLDLYKQMEAPLDENVGKLPEDDIFFDGADLRCCLLETTVNLCYCSFFVYLKSEYVGAASWQQPEFL